jgi:hypothetical protein
MNNFNWTRVIISGIILWIIILFLTSAFGLREGIYNWADYLSVAIIVLIVSLVYFKGEDVKVGIREGLLAGFVFVAIGIILDAIITIPLFVGAYSFFLSPYLWIGYLEIIIITAIVGEVSK